MSNFTPAQNCLSSFGIEGSALIQTVKVLCAEGNCLYTERFDVTADQTVAGQNEAKSAADYAAWTAGIDAAEVVRLAIQATADSLNAGAAPKAVQAYVPPKAVAVSVPPLTADDLNATLLGIQDQVDNLKAAIVTLSTAHAAPAASSPAV